MDEGLNLALDIDGKDDHDVLKKEERSNINEDSKIDQHETDRMVKKKTQRIATLDAFRGLTIVIMILVDKAGGVYPSIDHAPWNGCTLADFVMPFFLFIVGVAIALALKRIEKIKYAVKKIMLRTLKLLFWGILLQGGYSHAPDDLSYGVNMKFIRWCGILQRIGLVYCVVALIETFTTKLRPSTLTSGRIAIFTAYKWQWFGGFMAFLIYMITTFTLYVPDWSFVDHVIGDEPKRYTVICGMRGHIGPACNAVGHVDRQVWGVNHFYSHPVWRHLKECTFSSPGEGPIREDAPSWCHAPFEPEGLLSSISAILSGTIGIHYGHVLIHFKGHSERLKHWVSMGFVLLTIAIILHFTNAIPINKQLYSISYVCFTAGVAGIVFSVLYILIDVWGFRTPFLFLEWIGMNSMLVFVMAAQGIFAGFVNGWYYEDPNNSLVHWIKKHVFVNVWNSERVGTLLYVIFAEITFWGVVAAMDEGTKRMEEGINVALDIDEAKDEVLKKQETTNIKGNSSIDQHDTDTMAKPALVKQKTKRVATLDAFRGLTIVLMILVDDAGEAYPRIDHSPWNGCTLADFVMPFFLFIVGVAIALALKRIPNIKYAMKKIILRTLKLLFWGIILQGGYSHAPDELKYGVDMKFIRWCGILQRIALVYCVVALIETLTTKLRPTTLSPGRVAIFSAYKWQWFGGFIAFLIYIITTFALYVPDWSFVDHVNGNVPKRYTVLCGVRGDLGPACNAVGYVDRRVWGVNHLYSQPVWRRLKACTFSYPGEGKFRDDAPSWCLAPYEPEGLLSSISAILSGTIGIHYGHVLIHFKGHSERLKQWLSMGFVLLIIAIVLHFTDAIPINKQLYSLSYVCFTAGAAGIVFSALYLLIDVCGIRTPFLFLEWIGMNAMLVFVMAAQGIFAAFVNGWYYEDPNKSLVHWIKKHVFVNVWNSEKVGTLLYVIFAEITFWGVVAGVLHKLKIYWKL